MYLPKVGSNNSVHIALSMSHRPGLAARRFYRSFYQWNLLATDIHTRLPAGRYATHFHAATGTREEDRGDSPPIRKHLVASRTPYVETSPKDAVVASPTLRMGTSTTDEQRGGSPGDSRASRQVANGPALSPIEKPFSTFESFQRVVRYRSPKGLLLELALPTAELQRAQKKYGPDLESIASRTEARVEVQDISAPLPGGGDDRIHSILISGSFDQVIQALEFLKHPSQILPPLSKYKVFSQEEMPSKKMTPWKFVLRSREESQVIAEMSVLEEMWDNAFHQPDWAREAFREGIALEVGLPEPRPTTKNSHATAAAKSLVMKGPAEAVARFRDRAASFMGYGGHQMRPKVAKPPLADRVDLSLEAASDKAVQGSDDPLTRCNIHIHGKDVSHPGLIDAIWRDIERPHPDVRIFRPVVRQPFVGECYFEVIGPSSLVNTVCKNISQDVYAARSRFNVRRVWLEMSTTDTYKYRVNFTGKDALKVRLHVGQRVPWRDWKKLFGVRAEWTSHMKDSAQWYAKVVCPPRVVGEIEKLLLGIVREIGEELKAVDVKVTWTLDTMDEELPLTKGSSLDDASSTTVIRRVSTADSGRLSNIALEREVVTRSAPPTLPSAEPRRDEVGEMAHLRLEKTPEQQKQLAEQVRASLRSLTHPVALVTSYLRPSKTRSIDWDSLRGVTVSSFNTVTLDSQPIISFNLKVPSRSWDAIRESQRLRVHLLEASNRGAAIAQAFTRPHDHPGQAFLELRESLQLQIAVNRAGRPPIIQDCDHGAVLAHMEAYLLPEKCVVVGDHVVVLAEVANVTFGNEKHEDLDGLAYAKRGYRMRGQEVYPDEMHSNSTAGGIRDPLMLAPDEPAAQPPEPLAIAEETATPEDPYAWFNMDDDPIFNALRATRDVKEGEFIDIYAAMAMEDEFDLSGHESGTTRLDSNKVDPKRPAKRRSVRAGGADSDGEPVPAEKLGGLKSGADQSDESRSTQSTSFRYVISPLEKSVAANNEDKGIARTFGGSARSSTLSTHSSTPGSRRSFSSTASTYQKDEDDSRLIVIDAATKNTTVADFLGVPDDNKRPRSPRVRSLVRFQKDIRAAESRLEKEELSEEEVTALQNSVAYQERIIAKKLAWNAAGDLRLMLDKGNARVDFKRAQWLESAVEQGLKVLLDDARRLRQKREEGKVDAVKYDMLRVKLQNDHGVLQTELIRLRAVADEDED